MLSPVHVSSSRTRAAPRGVILTQVASWRHLPAGGRSIRTLAAAAARWVTLTAAGQGAHFCDAALQSANHGRCKPIFSNSKSCI